MKKPFYLLKNRLGPGQVKVMKVVEPLDVAVVQGQRFLTDTLAPHLMSALTNHFLCYM